MSRDLLSISWWSDLTSVRSRRPGRRRVASRSACRPGVEVLERRLTLTTLPPGFTEAPVVSGLSSPTAMEFAPDGRLFVLEQGGNVKLVHNDGTTWTALHLNVDSNGERGLLGIAFDPNYNANHFVYLYYTNPNPGGASWATGEHNQLSRFTVNDSNPQQPTFTDEAPILDWNNLISATNHNGGAIHFGLDGMLYADAGDNTQTFSQGGSTYRVSQTLSDLLGKQLRIDVSAFNSGVATRDDATVGHLIPTDNPFVGTASGINQLIYNLGLRNPFSFAVQPGTGTIYINDVGENVWEEIDQSVAGANYGWSGGETDGFGPLSPPPPGPGTYHDPLLAYNHSGGPAGGGDAIVGGTFYDPATPSFPSSYVGKYFYADLDGGWIRVFDPAKPGNASNPDTSTAFASGTPGSLRDLKVDSSGNLYYLAGNGGVINKIYYRSTSGSTQVNLASSFNRIGIVADGTIFSGGGLDADGNALSANLLGTSVTVGGVAFNLGPTGANNVVSAAGQAISLPAGNYASLQLLATAINGNQANQAFTVKYSDGTTATFTQSISDWYTPQNYSGESSAVTMSYRDKSDGTKDSRTFHVYRYSFALDATKTITSITLPNQGNVKILAIDLVS